VIDRPDTAVDLRARAGVRALRSSKIRDAAIAELNAGNTFCTQGLGAPELRAALADYGQRLHGRGSVDRIAVTNSGTSALMVRQRSCPNR